MLATPVAVLRPHAPRGIVTGVAIALLSGGANLSLAGVLPEVWSHAEPLVVEPVREVVPEEQLPALPASPPVLRADPLAVPRCPGLTLTAVSQLEDTAASLATVRSGSGSGVTRAFRGSIAGRKVVYVGDNPRLGRPAVWLTAGSSLCQVVMRDAPVPARPEAVERSFATEFRADRSLLEAALAHPEMLGARIDLTTMAGASGLRLASVTPGKLLHTLGFRNGDRIESINGFPLGSAEDATRALAALARAHRLSAVASRDGVRRTVDLTLE